MEQNVIRRLRPGDIGINALENNFSVWNGVGFDPEQTLDSINIREDYKQLFTIEDTAFYRPILAPTGPFIRSMEIAAHEARAGQFFKPDPEVEAEEISSVRTKSDITVITTQLTDSAITVYRKMYYSVIRVYIDNPDTIQPANPLAKYQNGLPELEER